MNIGEHEAEGSWCSGHRSDQSDEVNHQVQRSSLGLTECQGVHWIWDPLRVEFGYQLELLGIHNEGSLEDWDC